MYKRIYLFLAILMTLASCSIINIQSRTNLNSKSYSELSEQERMHVCEHIDCLKTRDSSYIFHAVSAKTLKEYVLNSRDTALVYEWKPFCSSDVCIDIDTFLHACAKLNYTPIVLMSRYYFEMVDASNLGKVPV